MEIFSWTRDTKPHPGTLRYCFVGKNFVFTKTMKILPPQKYPLCSTFVQCVSDTHYVHAISDVCCIAIHMAVTRVAQDCHALPPLDVYGNTAHIRNGVDIVTCIRDMGCGMGEWYGHSGMDWRHGMEDICVYICGVCVIDLIMSLYILFLFLLPFLSSSYLLPSSPSSLHSSLTPPLPPPPITVWQGCLLC